MKLSKSTVHRKTHSLPALRFEDQKLSSYAGLILFQSLFAKLAHNLNREMQMQCLPKARRATDRRAPLWQFERLGTLRRKLIQRAGRLTEPQGQLTLTMSVNPAVRSELLHYLDRLRHAA